MGEFCSLAQISMTIVNFGENILEIGHIRSYL